jgi:alpha-D-xyloside xylohydrolase
MKDSGIPISVFHFDCFWMKERHWCNFLWNSDAFPRPAEMIKRIKKMGIRICLWINPYISELSEIYKEAEENGYLLKHPDGSPYQIDWWQPGNSFVDFSNPNACEWYKKKLRALLDMGVDTFKTDFGESAPKDAVYYNGISGKLMHNRYTILYNKTVFSLLEEYHGKQNAIVFARSCAPGGQRYPVHWGGDSQANFSSMAGQLRGGLSFGLSGGAFWSHDIGGFFGKPNAAVYKRWIAFGLLSSHSRLHGNESYRVPWNYDEESVDVLRFFKRLRQSLLPYLVGVCNEASRTGVPVLRSMIIEFPENDLCCHLDRQYMLGPSILVAPVFASNGEVGYYLPPGKWTNLLTNEPREGGRWLKETHTVFSLPLYVRENSIIPRCDEDNNPDGTEYKGISIDLYQISNKTGFRFELKEEIELTAEKKAEQIELSSSKPISAAVRCMPSGSSATLNNESKIVL